MIAARCVALSRQSNLAIGPSSTHADVYKILRIGRMSSTVERIVQFVVVTVSRIDNELHACVVRVDTAAFISTTSAVHPILLNPQPGGRNFRTVDRPTLALEQERSAYCSSRSKRTDDVPRHKSF